MAHHGQQSVDPRAHRSSTQRSTSRSRGRSMAQSSTVDDDGYGMYDAGSDYDSFGAPTPTRSRVSIAGPSKAERLMDLEEIVKKQHKRLNDFFQQLSEESKERVLLSKKLETTRRMFAKDLDTSHRLLEKGINDACGGGLGAGTMTLAKEIRIPASPIDSSGLAEALAAAEKSLSEQVAVMHSREQAMLRTDGQIERHQNTIELALSDLRHDMVEQQVRRIAPPVTLLVLCCTERAWPQTVQWHSPVTWGDVLLPFFALCAFLSEID